MQILDSATDYNFSNTNYGFCSKFSSGPGAYRILSASGGGGGLISKEGLKTGEASKGGASISSKYGKYLTPYLGGHIGALTFTVAQIQVQNWFG